VDGDRIVEGPREDLTDAEGTVSGAAQSPLVKTKPAGLRPAAQQKARDAPMLDFLYPCLFWALAAMIAVSAIAMVVTQNIVRAATWLLFTLAGTAGIFFLLGADFVGATQLLVYVGGTLVLVVFGVMLTAQGPFITMKIGAGEWAIASAVGIGFFSVLAFTLLGFNPEVPPPDANAQPSTHFAEGMFQGAAPVAAQTESPYRSLAASVVLGEALLGFDHATPEVPLTGVRDVNESAAGGPPQRAGAAVIPAGGTSRLKQRKSMAYLLPFEIVSVHLLVVLIGAAYLARSKRRRGAVS
jgi:NADH-quinone oxidoreductase subunit J